MTLHEMLLPLAATGYLGASFSLYRQALAESRLSSRLPVLLALAGFVLHALAEWPHWFGPGSSFGLLNVLSLCALAVVGLLLVSLAARTTLFEAGLVAFPIAALVILAEWAFDTPGNRIHSDDPRTLVHVATSIFAFGVLSIAAVYALFVAIIDHFLRRHSLNPLIRALPALDVLERMLFTLIALGFAALTLTLATGILFIDDLFAQHLAHKTVLSLLAWSVFGVLLVGRWLWGWRGRLAVRLTLAGVALLLLSYFGSKLVLELVLHRSWQA